MKGTNRGSTFVKSDQTRFAVVGPSDCQNLVLSASECLLNAEAFELRDLEVVIYCAIVANSVNLSIQVLAGLCSDKDLAVIEGD